MQPFTTLTGTAAPLPIQNIDTDMIIPKQFLTTISRTGLGEGLFYEMRVDMDGNRIEDFVLNQPGYDKAQILVAEDNFGCGSSREHAPWALLDFGIRCVIAPSFADIFYNNCFKNGILPIRMPQADVTKLMAFAKSSSNNRITIDLPNQTISPQGQDAIAFEMDAGRKKVLVEGLDDINQTLQHEEAIKAFEAKQAESQPWLYAHASNQNAA